MGARDSKPSCISYEDAVKRGKLQEFHRCTRPNEIDQVNEWICRREEMTTGAEAVCAFVVFFSLFVAFFLAFFFYFARNIGASAGRAPLSRGPIRSYVASETTQLDKTNTDCCFAGMQLAIGWVVFYVVCVLRLKESTGLNSQSQLIYHPLWNTPKLMSCFSCLCDS